MGWDPWGNGRWRKKVVLGKKEKGEREEMKQVKSEGARRRAESFTKK